MKNSIIKIAVIVLAALSSCNRASKDSFSIRNPDSKEFKNELAKKIKADDGKLTYSFNSFKVKGTMQFINVDIEGVDFHATTAILVENWGKLSQIRENKGVGYSGAQLKGLKLTIEDTSNGAVFKYKDVKEIID